VTCALGGEALALGGLAADAPGEDGAGSHRAALEDGRAAEVRRDGRGAGRAVDFVERWRDRLPSAPVQREVPAPESGIVDGDRRRGAGLPWSRWAAAGGVESDRIDPAVGLSEIARRSGRRSRRRSAGLIHAATEDAADRAAALWLAAFTLGRGPVDARPDPGARRLMPRAFLIVLDSVGCGGAPDAADFGDAGANTLGHIAQACAAGRRTRGAAGPLRMPVLDGWGWARRSGWPRA
jgi:hypothetical protein